MSQTVTENTTKNAQQSTQQQAPMRSRMPLPEEAPKKSEYQSYLDGLFSPEEQTRLEAAHALVTFCKRKWESAHNWAEKEPKNVHLARYLSGLWHTLFEKAQRLSAIVEAKTAITEEQIAPLQDHRVMWKPFFGNLSLFDEIQIAEYHEGDPKWGRPQHIRGMLSASRYVPGYAILRANHKGYTLQLCKGINRETKQPIIIEFQLDAVQALELLEKRTTSDYAAYDRQAVKKGGDFQWRDLKANGVSLGFESGAYWTEPDGSTHVFDDPIRISIFERDFKWLVYATLAERDERAAKNTVLVEMAAHTHTYLGDRQFAANVIEMTYLHLMTFVPNLSVEKLEEMCAPGSSLFGYRPEDFADIQSFYAGWEQRLTLLSEQKQQRQVEQSQAKAVQEKPEDPFLDYPDDIE